METAQIRKRIKYQSLFKTLIFKRYPQEEMIRKGMGKNRDLLRCQGKKAC